MTPELREEIRLVLDRGPEVDAYFVPRKNYFLGRWIKHCGWYPDYRQPQLFRKGRFRYREELVHESFDCDGPVGFLKSPALQYPFRDIDHYVAKQDRYSDLMARRMAGAGPTIFLSSTDHPSARRVSQDVCAADRLPRRHAWLDSFRTLCLLHRHEVREILGAHEIMNRVCLDLMLVRLS